MQFGFYLRTFEFFKTRHVCDLECIHRHSEIYFPIVAFVSDEEVPF